MDKTSTGKPPNPTSLLRQMLDGMLLGISRGRVVYAGEPSVTEVRPPHRPSRREFPFYPADQHHHAELIFSSRGGVQIYSEGDWRPYRANEVWAFLPGVVHSERRAERQQGYCLLWAMITREAVGYHMTAYSAGQGYHLKEPRLAVRSAVQAYLWDAIAACMERPDERSRLRFQGLVMNALCQTLDEIDKPHPRVFPYQRQAVEKVLAHIDAHHRFPISIAQMARSAHYSPCHLNYLFRKYVGKPIHQCILEKRLDHATRLLQSTSFSVKQVALEAGFSDPLYFSRLYRRRFGHPPSKRITNR
jgi:AraC-like DNA-binding protein